MCQKHPKYLGKKKPSSRCADCWKLYNSIPANALNEQILKVKKGEEDRQIKLVAKEAVRRVGKLEKELEAILCLRENLYTHEIIASPELKSEATAIWLASDWHVGERVTLGQTNGINKYNPTISGARGEQYFKTALRITKVLGQDVAINNVVLALLGD